MMLKSSEARVRLNAEQHERKLAHAGTRIHGGSKTIISVITVLACQFYVLSTREQGNEIAAQEDT